MKMYKPIRRLCRLSKRALRCFSSWVWYLCSVWLCTEEERESAYRKKLWGDRVTDTFRWNGVYRLWIHAVPNFPQLYRYTDGVTQYSHWRQRRRNAAVKLSSIAMRVKSNGSESISVGIPGLQAIFADPDPGINSNEIPGFVESVYRGLPYSEV